MFDLLLHSPLLREHAGNARVGFGINCELSDFQTARKKNLDLVIARPARETPLGVKRGNRIKRPIITFVDLKDEYEVQLTRAEQELLDGIPSFRRVSVGTVCVALEAKAVMTAHIKALPRLHDELDSSHLTIHGHADHSIAAALATINAADTFISSDLNKVDLATQDPVVSRHEQPKDTDRTIEKVLEIRRRTRPGEQGFDALGIMLVKLRNDGSPCAIVAGDHAGALRQYDYAALIERVTSQYHAKFQGI